jgi:virulence factor Mce-like protein
MAVGSRSKRRGRPPLVIGAISLAIVVALVFLGFTKDVPFVGAPYRINATFESANSIRSNSPVRIAGVNVGKVEKVSPQKDGNGAVVTMQIKKEGLPIHRDATAKIRPRIFLEGNFFVDLRPGTPSSPVLDDGDMIRVTQTATPVQLDQVLTTLQEDTRQDLKDTLAGLDTAFNEKPLTGEKTGAEAINATFDDSPAALRSTAIVNEAFLGIEPEEDLQRLIRGLGRTSGALVRNETQLKELITNFNTTMGALASESDNLKSTIRLLAPVSETANEAFASLNAAFPGVRSFAREILPGVRETPETIRVSFPWIAETRKLLRQSELRGLAQNLAPATADLARLTDRLRELLPQTTLTSKCLTQNLLPTGDVVIKDEFTSGVANYKEFMHTMVGLSGEGANFDGNGPYVRFQPGGGDQTVSLGGAGGTSPLFGSAAAAPLGTRPAYPGKLPVKNTGTPCFQSTPPNLNGPAARKGGSDANTAAKVAARKAAAR